MSKVLVIDSDATRCEALKTILEFVELKPVSVCDPNRWREALAGSTCFDLVMLGSCGDERRQRDLLRLLNGQESNLPVIALRPEGPESGLARETRSESVASVSYPLRNHELQHALQQVEIFRENRHLAGNPRSLELFRNLVGSSEGIRGVRRLIEQVAGADATVLLLGESGTGKEVVARNIHYHSARRYKPFVPVNCGAIPADLLESELFGHERGAFTGAISARRGRFEMADGGTLFLDEIGDMPLAMQVKLLRVLQERTFERVGSNKSVSVDVRIIGATHSDLEESIALGKFRDDLYYRLNVFPIEMPPLRSRTEDLSLLVNDLLVRMENEKRGSIRMTPAAMDALGRYPWPGNVRELANLVERLTILYPYGVVDAHDLPEKYQLSSSLRDTNADADLGLSSMVVPTQRRPRDGMDLKEHLAKLETMLIVQALEEADGIIAHAAKRLRMGRTTLVEMRKLGIHRQEEGARVPAALGH